MNNNKKSVLIISFLFFVNIIFGTCYFDFSKANAAAPVSQTKTAVKNQAKQNNAKIINATSLAIVASPSKYLNKTVKMQATFDKFSTLGLDYNKALRKSTDYIGILIQRDDVINHNIPLSEMKIFLKKDLAEKHIDLDTGDKIEIVANVFSTALNDPWLDVVSIKLIKKAKTAENKK